PTGPSRGFREPVHLPRSRRARTRMMAALGILLAAVAVATACMAICSARYRHGFRFAPRRDDHFHWNAPAARHELAMAGQSFELPDGIEGRGQPALLRVTVRAAPAAACRDPHVDMHRGALRCRQYLDRGARGARYLDATALLSHADTRRVQLRGAGLSIGSRAELLLFEPPT